MSIQRGALARTGMCLGAGNAVRQMWGQHWGQAHEDAGEVAWLGGLQRAELGAAGGRAAAVLPGGPSRSRYALADMSLMPMFCVLRSCPVLVSPFILA